MVINMEFKWSDDLLQKKINEKIVENLMEKLNNHSDVVSELVDYEITKRNLIESLSEYECKYGFTPNKIIMGNNVYQCFRRQFYYGYIEEEDLKSYPCTFYGVPVEVDHSNPNRLEIGHMIKLA